MVRLELSDTALAKLAAQVAADVPGVVRMAPSLGDRIKGAAVRAARQLTDAPVEDVRAADPSAVDLDADDDDGPLTVSVRIIAGGEPPVFEAVAAVRAAVTGALQEAGRPVASVTVIVVDTEA